MTRKNVKEFKLACKEFLTSYSLHGLRPYGREVGVHGPTKKDKDALIEAIVSILAGELAPEPRSKRGAPVKDDTVDPKIYEYIGELCALYPMLSEDGEAFDFKSRLKDLQDHPFTLMVEDPNADVLKEEGREIVKGQLETLNGVSMLLPLKCVNANEKIVVAVEMIREYGLREGDIITGYTQKRNNALVLTTVLSINDLPSGSTYRGDFDTLEACYPQKKWGFLNSRAYTSVTEKYLDWLLPIGKGQRGVVIGAPKSGKTSFLLDVVESLSKIKSGVHLFVSLIDQPPEIVAQFQKHVKENNLVYSTYEDEADRQVFAAEFLLKRAKRYAESGKDVFLVVDSFNALARAYNETDASMGGRTTASGLESKTVQYIKRFLGAGRCFARGGSLTILGSVGVDTGNPADEFIKSELSSVANFEMYFNSELAQKRVYPAIDFIKSRGNGMDTLRTEEEKTLDVFLRNEYFSKHNDEHLIESVRETSSFAEFESKIK